jgi:hypothetical protein
MDCIIALLPLEHPLGSTICRLSRLLSKYDWVCRIEQATHTLEGAMHAPDEWLQRRVVNHQFYINIINQIICCSLPSIIPFIAAPPTWLSASPDRQPLKKDSRSDGRDVLHAGRPKLSDLVTLVVHLISTSSALFDTRTSVDCRLPVRCAGPARLSFRTPVSEH